MKQDVEIYLTDSFVDYAGREHKIVACALSQSPDSDETTKLKVGWTNKDIMIENSDLCEEIYRMVTIGMAICNPTDEFDEEKGKKIAYHKAANSEYLPRLYTPGKGIITRELVEVFLNQQVRFVKENPEILIPGYNKAEASYKAKIAAKAEIDNLTPEEKTVFDLAIKGVNISKCVDLAKIYVKKILCRKDIKL